jgi:Protein kinase domain
VASRALGLALGAVGLFGGAALAVLAPPPPPKPRIDAGALSGEIDGRLREVGAGLHSRVTTLAEIPRLAAAVSTDEVTVRNLTREELAFRTKPGEVLTIGQVPKKGDGKPTALLTLPDGAADVATWDQPGARLGARAGKLLVTEVVTVTPRDRADEVNGALAVSWEADLTAVASKLTAVGAGARIEIGADAVELGKLLPGDPTAAPPLGGELGKGVKLTISVPSEPAGSPPLRQVGIAIAVVGLILGGWLSRRRAAPPLSPSTAASLPAATAPSGPRKVTSPEATAQTAMALEGSGEGVQVGRYTIVRRLGSGGMAEVFLARVKGEAGFEKLVALKVLHKAFTAQAMVVEHFLDEARLATRLTHPNIVQISDLGKAGDEYYIAMEYIDGADLERLLFGCRQRGEWVPLRVALTILRKICDGLHAAHTATAADGKPLDLVHRDVKSANVFVAKNGVVKVGDFGIAKANVASRVNKTEIGQVKGTAAYMAPEHRVGQAVDRRADLYAVGAIAYEMLTGQEVDLDLAVLADKGKEGWPHLPKPSSVRPELPPVLDEILWKALAYDKNARYADCAQLEEAFEAVANQLGSVAGEKVVAQWVEAALAAEPRAEASAS